MWVYKTSELFQPNTLTSMLATALWCFDEVVSEFTLESICCWIDRENEGVKRRREKVLNNLTAACMNDHWSTQFGKGLGLLEIIYSKCRMQKALWGHARLSAWQPILNNSEALKRVLHFRNPYCSWRLSVKTHLPFLRRGLYHNTHSRLASEHCILTAVPMIHD